MLHTNHPIIKHKAGLLNLAKELGNVSKTCKIMGVSRDTFYHYQELIDEGGIDPSSVSVDVVRMLRTESMKSPRQPSLIRLLSFLPMDNTEPVMD